MRIVSFGYGYHGELNPGADGKCTVMLLVGQDTAAQEAQAEKMNMTVKSVSGAEGLNPRWFIDADTVVIRPAHDADAGATEEVRREVRRIRDRFRAMQAAVRARIMHCQRENRKEAERKVRRDEGRHQKKGGK